jgi:hypothetical protein
VGRRAKQGAGVPGCAPAIALTDRRPPLDKRIQFRRCTGNSLQASDATTLICDDVLQAVRDGRSPLVLTERHDHLEQLVGALQEEVQHLLVLRGQMKRRQREELTSRLVFGRTGTRPPPGGMTHLVMVHVPT